MNNQKQIVQGFAAGLMFVLACTIIGMWLLSADTAALRAPDELIVVATQSGDAEADRTARQQAARELVAQATDATEMLRQLAADSDDPAVRATALQGLGKARDRDSAPMLVQMLDHQNPQIRGQANAALIKIYQCDLGFRANDPTKERATAAAQWRAAVRLETW